MNRVLKIMLFIILLPPTLIMLGCGILMLGGLLLSPKEMDRAIDQAIQKARQERAESYKRPHLKHRKPAPPPAPEQQ